MTMIIDGSTGLEFPDGSDQTSAYTGNASTITSGVLAVANGGTGASSSAAAPFALKGANSDITSLNGLTTALSIAQGGTGQTTRQAAMDALAGAVTAGRYLRGDGTDVIMDTLKAADMTGTLAIANGGTGSTTAADARAALGTNDAANITTGTIGTARLASGTANSGTFLRGDQTWSALPSSGKVLQIVQVTKTDRFSTTSTSYVDITGMTANITPSSSSSRILVMVDLKGSASNSSGGGVQLQRNSSAIYIGDAQGSRRRSSVGGYWPFNGAAVYGGMAIFLDSPATTSSVNYKLQCVTNGATFAVNSSHAYTDSTDNLVLASSITLLEIAA